MSYTVTLKQLRDKKACVDRYNRLVCNILGREYRQKETHIRCKYEEKISLLSILESNGLDDAIWSLRCIDGHDREIRLFALWCARQVEHFSRDDRVKHCNDITEKYISGESTRKELTDAMNNAMNASLSAHAYSNTTDIVIRRSAESASWSACCSASAACASESNDNTEIAAAAWTTARYAIRSYAWNASPDVMHDVMSEARYKQEEKFIEMFSQ